MTAVMSYHPLDGHGWLSVPAGEASEQEHLTHGWGHPTPTLSYSSPHLVPFVHSADDLVGHVTSTVGSDTPPVCHTLSSHNSPWPGYGFPPTQHELQLGYTAIPQSIGPTSDQLQRPISVLEDRPCSGSGSFATPADTLHWLGAKNSLSLHYSHPTNLSSVSAPTFSTDMASVSGTEVLTSPSPPEIRQPQPVRSTQHSTSHPVTLGAKRSREDDDEESVETTRGKRRKRTSSLIANDLGEDDRFLISLKEDENLAWKDIAARFGSHHGRTFQVAALQMRYKRLRERVRVWEPEDVEALRLAHEYWEKSKWEIISQKMLDCGISERWPAKHCAKNWAKLHPPTQATVEAAPPSASLSFTPALSVASSNADQYQFMGPP